MNVVTNSSGLVMCWGYNEDDLSCCGPNQGPTRPTVPVEQMCSGSSGPSGQAGYYCALTTAEKNLACWGFNAREDRLNPPQGTGPYLRIACGANTLCLIDPGPANCVLRFGSPV